MHLTFSSTCSVSSGSFSFFFISSSSRSHWKAPVARPGKAGLQISNAQALAGRGKKYPWKTDPAETVFFARTYIFLLRKGKMQLLHNKTSLVFLQESN